MFSFNNPQDANYGMAQEGHNPLHALTRMMKNQNGKNHQGNPDSKYKDLSRQLNELKTAFEMQQMRPSAPPTNSNDQTL